MARRLPNPVDIHVGARVRMRRVMMGMTQAGLGHRLGVTFQQVQKYEKGMNRVGASRLLRIADILQAEPSFFFDGAPGNSPARPTKSEMKLHAYVNEFIAAPGGLALASAFMRIKNVHLRRSIVRLVTQLTADANV